MSFTMTRSATETWSLTYAKYLASKVAADMWRCQDRYGRPTEAEINDFGTELALLLRDGYVAHYEFGFKKGEDRVVSWYYTVNAAGTLVADDRPGGIYGDADITGAVWFNSMGRTQAWWNLTDAERESKTSATPIRRVPGSGPKDGLGYWVIDRTYSAAGVDMSRKTFRPFGT